MLSGQVASRTTTAAIEHQVGASLHVHVHVHVHAVYMMHASMQHVRHTKRGWRSGARRTSPIASWRTYCSRPSSLECSGSRRHTVALARHSSQRPPSCLGRAAACNSPRSKDRSRGVPGRVRCSAACPTWHSLPCPRASFYCIGRLAGGCQRSELGWHPSMVARYQASRD